MLKIDKNCNFFLHRIHLHFYFSGTILNGCFIQNIGDGEHIRPVCRF